MNRAKKKYPNDTRRTILKGKKAAKVETKEGGFSCAEYIINKTTDTSNELKYFEMENNSS